MKNNSFSNFVFSTILEVGQFVTVKTAMSDAVLTGSIFRVSEDGIVLRRDKHITYLSYDEIVDVTIVGSA